VQISLAGAEDEESLGSSQYEEDRLSKSGRTYTVDSNGTKNGGGDSSAVGGVFLRAHHGVIVCLEESTNDGKNDDGEDGDDNAVARLTDRLKEKNQVGAPCPGIESRYDGLHCGWRCAVVEAAIRGCVGSTARRVIVV
jgi:hypothetical protein